MRLRLTLAAALLLGCTESTAPPSPDDPQSLLTDAQLATPPDPAEVPVDPAWEQWVRNNHHTVRSLTSERDDDLRFLKPVIGARRLVQLGESGHGVREFNMAKVRLIKFLHEEMGFDVIAFESGLFECWKANQLGDARPDSTMSRCIFGVWYTHEVFELFDYIRETRGTSRPLILAGMDVQMTGGTAQRYAPAFLAEVIGRVDPAYAARVRALEEEFHQYYPATSSQFIFDPVARAKAMTELDARFGFTARYDSLRTFVEANAAAFAAAYPSDRAMPLLAGQIAWTRTQNMAQAKAAVFNDASTLRDRGMADNVDFLLDRLYPGKKIIVWAHNAHIMHARKSMALLASSTTLPQSMGAFISERRRGDLYTIGLFMYRGSAANNAGQAYAIRPPVPGSLEAVMYRTRKQWTFVDMLGQTRSAGTSWMFDPIPMKEWGTIDFRTAPRAQFDGILFVDTVNPPKYYSPPTVIR